MQRENRIKSKYSIRYTIEEKESAIARMVPPYDESVPNLSKELGIFDATLYIWCKQARKERKATPGNGRASEKWRSEDKFLIVMEIFTINETELAEYYRENGLYKEKIETWKKTCMTAHYCDLFEAKKLNRKQREEKIKAKTL